MSFLRDIFFCQNTLANIQDLELDIKENLVHITSSKLGVNGALSFPTVVNHRKNYDTSRSRSDILKFYIDIDVSFYCTQCCLDQDRPQDYVHHR